MTLKELIEQYSYQNEGVYTLIDIENLCKEYAKICLEKAANEATCKTKVTPIKKDGFIEGYAKTAVVGKESITNIELP